MTGSVSLPQQRWGRWPAGPDGVWKAALRRQEVGAARPASREVARAARGRNGGAATFSSVLSKVRSGAASKHDQSGNSAMARFAQSSARRAWLSQADADWALFRGFRLPRAQDRRRSGRSHARDGGGEDQGRRKGRMVSTGGISRSSLSRRACHRRAPDRDRAHPRGAAGGLKREGRRTPLKARDDIRASRPGVEQRAAPHPALRATFPSGAGEGERAAAI